jgi:hypothetical protein
MLRALISEHPDRAERLLPHVEGLELSIQNQPAFCLQNVRSLFEAAHATIAPRLNVEFSKRDGFPGRMRRVIEALDFSIADHPESARINQHLSALLKGIDDIAIALADLSNVPNMRHGGSLDWGTLERQHAFMLGGLCDSLVSFLFEVAWNRPDAATMAAEPARYEDFAEFNDWLDDEYGEVDVAGSVFRTSRVLYLLDSTQYEAIRGEWDNEIPEADGSEEAA